MSSATSGGSDSAAAAAAAAAPEVIRKPLWTEDEDNLLREQVHLQGGAHSWRAISLALPGRDAKSCRQRWFLYLDPTIDAGKPFSPEEDKIIAQYQATYGNRWSAISQFLTGRTAKAVNNRWNSVLSKQSAHAHAHASTAAPAAGPEVTPSCVPLLPLEQGDARIDDRASTPPPTHVAEEDLTEDDPCATPTECLHLFPLVPGDLRVSAGAAASTGDLSCGADDPLTQLTLAPAGGEYGV